MTEQEAIANLKSIQTEYKKKKFGVEALDVSIKALEKQIAKKADFDNEDEIYICPSCGKSVGEHQNYCWNCGQRFYVD